ncbi:potassium channel family protein [Ottowia testudinis]|uniref:Two pore domain potassium channel family protein n=1 Tax=Ottowia testudinis TaxID=2816950 RepID=A0A975H4J4_9BURK|nr:potassium channel family protein [Ottowia testudinis]QTD46924.1 two pore domain potassium channel family protein [Ottowia testudinis]
MTTVLRLLVRLRRYPSAALLAVQLIGVLLYAVLDDGSTGRAGQVVLSLFGLVVLGLALRMVRQSPAASGWAMALAASVLVLWVWQGLAPSNHLLLAISLLEALFYLYAAGALITYMLQDDVATADELMAAGATFTVLAWAFAHLYMACQLLAPGTFPAAVRPDAPRTWFELLFLSFTTLAGVGLSDISPVKPMGRALVMLEELAGVMYIAGVVSRLIGLTITRRRSGDK